MSEDKAAMLDPAGMLNKCTALLRNRRKRDVSKKRRVLDRKRINDFV